MEATNNEAGAIWQTLSAIDCADKIEKKGNLTYLSWAWAWGIMMQHYPQMQFTFDEHEREPDGTMSVRVSVIIGSVQRQMWLPVMDNRNKPIPNPNSFAINTAKMRCLTKCFALFGLGHYIYAGEDLPSGTQEEERKVSEAEIIELVELLEATQTDIPIFLEFFKADSLENLAADKFERAKFMLRSKLNKIQGADNASH